MGNPAEEQYSGKGAELAAEIRSWIEGLHNAGGLPGLSRVVERFPRLREDARLLAEVWSFLGDGSPLSSRREFGGFRILRPLGRGGMGQVYLAVQTTVNRLVALKVLNSASNLSAEAVERFRREVEAAARLRHPHVAHLYCAGSENGQPWFAMEYVDGPSLEEHLKALDRKPSGAGFLDQSLRYLIDAARAVHAIHEAGIIHRDLKPQNILLTE